MSERETVVDAQVCTDELLKENATLRSEIAWRKDEARRLKRSIGTGRVYTKLRQSLRDAEEDNEVLRKRVMELETDLELHRKTPSFDMPYLKSVIKKLVQAGDGMQHGEWARCLCDKCAEWRKTKQELYHRHGSLCGEIEETGLPEIDEKALLLKVSEA